MKTKQILGGCLAFTLALSTMAVSPVLAAKTPPAPAPFQKKQIQALMPLKRGVNMFDWFMGPHVYSANHQANFTTQEQLNTLRAQGMDHVRIQIDSGLIAKLKAPEPVFSPQRIAALDEALRMLSKAKLAAVLVLTPERDMKNLATTADAPDVYAALWGKLAARYKHYSPRQVYFELLNEPHFQAYYASHPEAEEKWQTVQQKFIRAIRKETKSHTIISPVYDWDTVASAVKIVKVHVEPKLIYTAHFYDPMPFTHQGSTFLKSFQPLSRVPYPMNPGKQAQCQTQMQAVPVQNRNQFDWYCRISYDKASIDRAFQYWVTWGEKHRVPLYLGEFGTLDSTTASMPEMQTWLKDVRSTAEKYNIPWTLWAEHADQATLLKPVGRHRLDLVKALGLTPPKTQASR